MFFCDANGVKHKEAGPHNSGNKSSGLMNQPSPYFRQMDAFMCGERPQRKGSNYPVGRNTYMSTHGKPSVKSH